MDKTKNILEKLVKLPGIPGREEAVVEFLMNLLTYSKPL